MEAPIINQSEGCGRKEMGFGERGHKAEKGEPYTSLLGWVGHSSQNRRCVQDSTVPSAQAADHFQPVLRVSLLMSAQGEDSSPAWCHRLFNFIFSF